MFSSIAWAVSKVMGAFVWIMMSTLHGGEQALRAPLAQIHVIGLTQTLIVATIPFLTLVAAMKLMGGILRMIVVPLIFSFLLYIIVPALLAVRI